MVIFLLSSHYNLVTQKSCSFLLNRSFQPPDMSSVLCPSIFVDYWCRIYLWFRLMGGLQTKSMTSQRYRAAHKMADMRYYGNVMTTTRCYRCILHLQQYSRRLNLFVFIIRCFLLWRNLWFESPSRCRLYRLIGFLVFLSTSQKSAGIFPLNKGRTHPCIYIYIYILTYFGVA